MSNNNTDQKELQSTSNSNTSTHQLNNKLHNIIDRIEKLKKKESFCKSLDTIGISKDGKFNGKQSHCNIPPLLSDLKKDEVSIWGFSWLPNMSEFDENGMKNGESLYNDIIKKDRNYINPYAVHNMLLTYDINEHTSLAFDLSFPKDQGYEVMRCKQNQEWAEQRLQRGVGFAKEGKFNEAIRCYNEAIELVPTYADAFTARGAAFIKLGKYNEGINCLETALRINPNVKNAKEYRDKAQMMMTKSTIAVVSTNEYVTPRVNRETTKPKEKHEKSTKDIDDELLALLKKDADRSRSRSSHKRRHHSHDYSHHHHHHH